MVVREKTPPSCGEFCGGVRRRRHLVVEVLVWVRKERTPPCGGGVGLGA